MKKTFIFVMFAAGMLSLTGCGDEVQNPQNNGENPENNTEKGMTVFSTSDDTRTSMDADRKFYWTTGDQIFVEMSSGNWVKTTGSEISDDRKTANFYLSGALKEPKYNLVFTGSGSNSATQVTIKNEQGQSAWNNAEHIGTSGDCGVSEAVKQANGKYTFSLKHKAAYLMFQPYKPDRVTDGWKLMQIEIIDADGKPLCGTYSFDMNGLSNAPTSNGKSMVTLTCSGGFTLPNKTTWETTKSSIFAVIQPSGSETRNIKIRYTIKPTISVNNVADATFTITKEFSKSFSVDGVTTIRHELSAESYSTNIYYMWDAPVGEYYWKGVANPPVILSTSGTGYPENSSDSRWFNSFVIAPDPASRSCKDMPNVNAMAWYLMYGDPRWEGETPWYMDGTGAHIYLGGIWLKKWELITEKPVGSTIIDCSISPVGYNGETAVDYRSVNMQNDPFPFRIEDDNYRTKGRPSASEKDRYFFLPAISHVDKGQLSTLHGCYWLSSPVPNNSTNAAYYLEFAANYIVIANNGSRRCGRVVTPDWFQ